MWTNQFIIPLINYDVMNVNSIIEKYMDIPAVFFKSKIRISRVNQLKNRK